MAAADGNTGPTRRSVLEAGAAAGLIFTAAAPAAAQQPVPIPKAALRLSINGQERAVELDTRTTLLDALRNTLGLTGSKKGCDHGQCGACTVLVNGRRINACLTLAVMHEGDEITTIEGLAQGDALHPMQAAFVARDAFQCGYCTPGQICSAIGMLGEVAAGWPSHAGADVAAACRAQRRRDPRAHERQHLPLRRLSQHRRGDPRRGGGVSDAALHL